MNTKAIYNIIDAKQMSNKYVHTANKHKIKNRKPWKLTKEKNNLQKYKLFTW